MISLSQTLTHDKPEQVFVVIAGHGRFHSPLTNPFCAESWNDCHGPYRRYLWQALKQPHSAVYKTLARLARAHNDGQHVVIRTHEASHHGDILVAAVRYLAAKLPAAPPKPVRETAASALFLPGLEAFEEDDVVDPTRLVWLVGQQVTHLAYLWDVEGRYTALVPGHGLVKLDRYGSWYKARYRAMLSPRVRFAHLELTECIERTFAPLIERQRQAETTEVVAVHLPYLAHGIAASRIAYDERYDHWDLAPLDDIEPPVDPAEQAHECAVRQALMPPASRFNFFSLLPSKYTGEHVKPVIKTKPDGTRWILTREMQARGALHLYQRLD